jgi:hypothetical protein
MMMETSSSVSKDSKIRATSMRKMDTTLLPRLHAHGFSEVSTANLHAALGAAAVTD